MTVTLPSQSIAGTSLPIRVLGTATAAARLEWPCYYRYNMRQIEFDPLILSLGCCLSLDSVNVSHHEDSSVL